MKARAWFTLAIVALAVVVLLELFGPRQPDGTVTDWQYVTQITGILLALVAIVAGTITWRRRTKP